MDILAPYEKGPSDILNQQMPKKHLLHLLLVATGGPWEKAPWILQASLVHIIFMRRMSGLDEISMKETNFCQNPRGGIVSG